MKKPVLHYRKLSEAGAPLIALHGLFGSLENLGMVTSRLAAKYQVYAVDLPNHGNSPAIETMTIASMCGMIYQWMNAVGIAKAHFLGHSLGGKVCMEMSLIYPDWVDSLIVADIAPVNYPPRHHHVFEALRAVDLATIEKRGEAEQQMAAYITDTATRRFLLKNLVKVDNRWQWRINLDGIEADYLQLLAANSSDRPPYRQATLFIKGERSDYLLPAYHRQIFARFPKASIQTIANTGHWLHAEAPDEFVAIVEQFLGLYQPQ